MLSHRVNICSKLEMPTLNYIKTHTKAQTLGSPMTVALVLAYSSPAEAKYLAGGVMAYTEQYTLQQLIHFDVLIDRS